MSSFLKKITGGGKGKDDGVESALTSLRTSLSLKIPSLEGDKYDYEAIAAAFSCLKSSLDTSASVDDQRAPEEIGSQVSKDSVYPRVIPMMTDLPFEGKKDLASVFTVLLRNDPSFSSHVAENYDLILPPLIRHHADPTTALPSGGMVRECVRHTDLYRRLLNNTPEVWDFFAKYVHLPNFDVASDAFSTVRELLTRDKAVAAEFLDAQYDLFFQHYEALLNSENYITRRLSLKLLGELLLDRSNFGTMMRYISSKSNLKTMMNLLRDPSSNIQYEAFHVFKVFVANPRKPKDVVKILYHNKAKLVAYLGGFHKDKETDEQFKDEKELVIRTLEALEMEDEGAGKGEAPQPKGAGIDKPDPKDNDDAT